MKQKIFTFLLAILFAGNLAMAKDTIRVVPDYTDFGALNKAIAENGSNKVYLLEVNSYYTLTGLIELIDTVDRSATFEIIGETPTGDEYMPVVQTALGGNNLPFGYMFRTANDFTLKNVFVANQAKDGQRGNRVIQMVADSIRLEVDGCMVDPVGQIAFLQGAGANGYGCRVYLTNNTFLRQGDPYVVGSHFINNVFADTLYMENNTIVNSGNRIFSTPQVHEEKITKFVWFNHNTVVWHGVSLHATHGIPELYSTNNLFYDFNTFCQVYAWGAQDPDFGPNQKALSQIWTDTAYVDGSLEPLPSTRTSLWNRNATIVSKDLQDNVILKPRAYPDSIQMFCIPIIWNDETPEYYASDYSAITPITADSYRETAMFESDDFPNFIEDNTFHVDDPGWVDTRIVDHGEQVTLSAAWWFQNNDYISDITPLPEEQPSKLWDVDDMADTPLEYYPLEWPRWNGEYTNATLLTASNAGLPLGDLNAFPEAKAIWELNKEKINQHILDLNTDQIPDSELEKPVGVEDIQLGAAISVYPNPASDVLMISSENTISSISIYSITGSLVKKQNIPGYELNVDISELFQGVYFIETELSEGGVYSTKFIKK